MSQEFLTAIGALPFRQKMLLGLNWFAFFFGPFYFLALKLWKPGLSLLALVVVIGVLEAVFEMMSGVDIPRGVDYGVNGAIAYVIGRCANYCYYLKEVKGRHDWNPFEAFRKS
ncbi:DUF2628 domain-containing protein [Paraburkholderia aspalathi]|nr:DUF2628 domain-containing protein [Paraburkholderia aspalathi]